MLETDLNTGPYLAAYSNLKDLRWNQIKPHNFQSIYQIVQGNICPKLERLFLAPAKLECCSFTPEPGELEILRQLYAELKGRMQPAKQRAEPAIRVFFNDVRLDFGRSFEDYGFGQSLVDVHRYNLALDPLAIIDCRSVSRVNCLRLPDSLFEPNERQFSLVEFAHLYRNVRVVVLDQRNNEGRTIEATQFIRFLKSCKALVTLQMVHSRFPADLYTRLADEVESVGTLDRFVLFESEHFDAEINVRFLNSLAYLRHLRTNLATRPTMFELIETMRVGAVFEFEFSRAALNDHYYVCLIERLDSDEANEPRWNLLVQRQTRPQQQASVAELYRRTSDLTDLKNYFLCQPNLLVSAHWLDSSNPQITRL